MKWITMEIERYGIVVGDGGMWFDVQWFEIGQIFIIENPLKLVEGDGHLNGKWNGDFKVNEFQMWKLSIEHVNYCDYV